MRSSKKMFKSLSWLSLLLLAGTVAWPSLALAQEDDPDPVDHTEATNWEVEIEPYNTADTVDDVVALGGSTNCRIRLSTSETEDKQITLVCPQINATNTSKRISFSHASIPTASDGTLSLTLPKDGSWIPFSIYGAVGSERIGDAVIEAHRSAADGELKASADISVFWFQTPLMTISTSGATYTFNAAAGSLLPSGGNLNQGVVTLTAQITRQPPGLSCNAPQLINRKVGIVQNAVAPNAYKAVWDSPVWDSPIAGDSVIVPAQYKYTEALASTKADVAEGNSGPCYVTPESVCTGMSVTSDTPTMTIVKENTIPAKTVKGIPTSVTYKRLISMNIEADFLDWCVLYDAALATTNLAQATQAQVESDWNLHVGSGATQQTPQINWQQSRAVTHSMVLTTDEDEFANKDTTITEEANGTATLTLTQ